jgi:hypothetical protein
MLQFCSSRLYGRLQPSTTKVDSCQWYCWKNKGKSIKPHFVKGIVSREWSLESIFLVNLVLHSLFVSSPFLTTSAHVTFVFSFSTSVICPRCPPVASQALDSTRIFPLCIIVLFLLRGPCVTPPPARSIVFPTEGPPTDCWYPNQYRDLFYCWPNHCNPIRFDYLSEPSQFQNPSLTPNPKVQRSKVQWPKVFSTLQSSSLHHPKSALLGTSAVLQYPRTTMVASTVLQGSGHPCGLTRLVTAKAAARKIDIQFFSIRACKSGMPTRDGMEMCLWSNEAGQQDGYINQ